MMGSPLVLVTGAGGFVGRASVRALRARGFRVLAGQRRPPRETDEIACDLDRPEEARAALRGVDLVVHAAYGDVRAMSSQNAHLLDAMSAVGARALVSLSSIAVYGEADGDVVETTPSRGELDDYARAKIACEAATRNWTAWSSDRRALLMRPGIVYGTASPFWIAKLSERIRLGAWGDFGPGGDGLAALIHVDDLADMIATSAQLLLSDRRAALDALTVVNAVGPETPTWNAYFHALAAKLGAAPPTSWSAGRLALRQRLATPAKIADRLRLPGFRAAALAPTRGEIALFSRSARYCGAAAAALGLNARVGLAEGLARTQV